MTHPGAPGWVIFSYSILGIDNRAAHVMTTVGAGDVRRRRPTALGTGLQLLGGQAVMRATLAGAGIGMFAFGDGHRKAPRYC